MSGLAEIAASASGREIVVLGDLVCDEYVYGETDRVSREAPVPIVRYERTERRAGGGANAAANVAALGARARVVGVVGADEQGEALASLLRAAGADVSRVVAVAGRRTDTKTRLLAGGRNSRRQQLLRLDRGPDGPLPRAAEDAVIAALRDAAAGADALLVSDYGSGTLSPRVVAEVKKLARAGLTVCVDSRYNLRAFGGVTVLKPNEVELEQASPVEGTPDSSRAQSPDAAARFERSGRALLRALACKALLVTRGQSGLALLRPRAATEHVPAHGAAEVVDVTGAGDTVMAAFTAALAASGDFAASARIANVAGALCVQKPGTATVGRAELLAELAGVDAAPRPANARIRR